MCCFGGPVAQLDRAPGYEPGCRRFDSSQARHFRWNPLGNQNRALLRNGATLQRLVLRQKQSCDHCHADENNHGDSALEPGSGDRGKRARLLFRRHRRIEHSHAGEFSRWDATARSRCLSLRFVLALSEFVRHYPQCYSHSWNSVQQCRLSPRKAEPSPAAAGSR